MGSVHERIQINCITQLGYIAHRSKTYAQR